LRVGTETRVVNLFTLRTMGNCMTNHNLNDFGDVVEIFRPCSTPHRTAPPPHHPGSVEMEQNYKGEILKSTLSMIPDINSVSKGFPKLGINKKNWSYIKVCGGSDCS